MAAPTSWKASAYDLPLARPYRWAKGVQTRRKGLLVRCGDGPSAGWGETAPPPHGQDATATLLATAQAVLREVARDAPGQGMEASLDAAAVPARLRHGILCAFLDHEARVEGLALGKVLAARYGLPRDPVGEVPVNALIEAVPPGQAARLAADAVAAGFRTLKLKSDGDPEGDDERLAAVRAAAGDRVRLRLDANEAWRPATAQAHLQRLARHGLEYVEQPLRAGRIQELAVLVRDSPVPIALDESVLSWAAVQPFVASGDPILILKPQRLGGPDRTLHVVRRAEEAGVRCVVTNSLETAVGRTHALALASLLPPPVPDCGLATEGFLQADVASGARTVAGWQAVPSGAGTGLQVQEGRLAAHVA